jgi:hypothetical protein
VGSDLDEVEVLLTGDALRVAQSKDAQLRSIDADESTGLRSDLLVDARSIGSGYLLHLPLVHGQAIKKSPCHDSNRGDKTHPCGWE